MKAFALFCCTVLAAGLFALSHGLNPHNQAVDSDLIAHEWGTFTSIAGNDGRAVQWLPQTGSTDLPAFVGHLAGADFKGGVPGTVRMETPVLYFYSPRETTVSVHVTFRNGLITEWYPHVTRATPVGNLRTVNLEDERTQGSVLWKAVHLDPASTADFPRDSVQTHYYAARATASTPLHVSVNASTENEKFLFYRGVASFHVPISVTANPDGDLLVRNLGTDEIPGLVLFERRGDRIGYRISESLQSETILESPQLTASLDSLRADLEEMLVSRGLHSDEAHAMIDTWRDSWFQEGTRLLYLVPESFVDSVLPLSIEPAPAKLVRVFVGRFEVVTRKTEHEIEIALARNDMATIDRFGRFFFPILDVIKERHPERAHQIEASLTALGH
jgi:hypothetical protein